jgi:hypothetical protein
MPATTRAVPSTAPAAAAARARAATFFVPLLAAGFAARFDGLFAFAAAAFFAAAGAGAFADVALAAAAFDFAAGGFDAAPARAEAVAVFFAAAAGAALLERLPPEPDFAAMTRPPLGPSPVHRVAESEG